VMVAESGARLLDPDAHRALVEEILPRATVLTPNLPEAGALVGDPRLATAAAGDDAAAERLVRAVLDLGPRIVVLTGGHRTRAADLFIDSADPSAVVSIEGPRHPGGAAHGSGCTHSSVVAAQLALGRSPLQAARTARELAGQAVAGGLRGLGGGAGPVDVVDLPRMRRT
jgi:hydroxymethylpyrimidine/phosphomethylpyrimidine kinase